MDEQSKINFLSIDRYLVKQLYPGCPFLSDEILISSKKGKNIQLRSKKGQNILLDKDNMFPRIFEKIDWWMYRLPHEFPAYVKLNWPSYYKETRDSSMVFPIAPFYEGADRGIGENSANVILREGDCDRVDDQTPDGKPTCLWELGKLLPATEEEYIEDGERIQRLKARSRN